MTPLRVFFGHHKCASRFFRMHLLGPAARSLGWPVVRYHIESPPFHFRRLDELDLYHVDFDGLQGTEPMLVNLSNSSTRVVAAIRAVGRPLRGIRVLRDPRQVLVSNYHHHLSGHNLEAGGWVWDKLKEDRWFLRRLSLEEGLIYELDNITRELLETQLFGWESPEDVLDVRLEAFTEDPGTWRARIAAHLDIPLEELPDPRNRSANPDARPWQDCFSPGLRTLFKKRYGQALIRLGYESDLDW